MNFATDKLAILSQTELPSEPLYIPEWKCRIIVKTMTGTERDAFEASHQAAQESGSFYANVRARLAVFTVCKESGERLFADSDAAALGNTHAKALDRIFDVAQRLNKLRKSDVDELEKNS